MKNTKRNTRHDFKRGEELFHEIYPLGYSDTKINWLIVFDKNRETFNVNNADEGYFGNVYTLVHALKEIKQTYNQHMVSNERVLSQTWKESLRIFNFSFILPLSFSYTMLVGADLNR